MISKPLFNKTSKGQIQTWAVEVLDNKFRTIEGLKGGTLTTSEWTICEGKSLGKKNETSPNVQATKEAQARFDKKLKKGYNEDEDKAGDIDFIKPMLATPWKDAYHKIVYPCMVDEKLNGVRVIVSKEGMTSRTGERFFNISCPHINEQLAPVFEKYPDAVLDGELFNDDLKENLNLLMEILGAKSEETCDTAFLTNSRTVVQLHLYDGYGFLGLAPHSTQVERRGKLCDLYTEFKSIKCLRKVHHKLVGSIEEITSFYEAYINKGGEGVIIRNLEAPYVNKRSKDLIKMKPLDDAEFEIIGIEEGTADWYGAARKFEMKHTGDCNDDRIQAGTTFTADFKGGTIADAKMILENKEKYIGKIVRIFYNGVTGTAVPKPNYAKFDFKNSVV